MAAKFDQEMMKKHHFWLLLIPLFIGLLLAWIGLFVNVADATEEKQAENDKNKKEIEAAKAQPKKMLDLYEEQKKELFELRTKRWLEMWDSQKEVFAWPESLDDTLFGRYKDVKFGTPILNSNALTNFQDQFVKVFEQVEKDSAPLQFNGGWQSVLRYTPEFARTPTSEDVWLSLEDYWVQRELIKGLMQVNKDAARFTRVTNPPPKTPDQPVVFANRTWQVELKIVTKSGGKALAGKIKNLTPRLQPFNANNQIVLKVWLSQDAANDPTSRPFLFVIEGTSLEGGKEEVIKDLDKRHIIYEGRVEEIAKVEQVFDARTAPVKRLDRMALYYPSARHAEAELQMTEFSKKAFETETAGATGTGAEGGFGGPPMPGAPGAAPSGPPIGAVGAGVGGPPGSASSFGGAGAAAPGEVTQNSLVRRRYIHKTDQVRAMPVGLGVVVDQAYVQELLTALANTRLRFQTVQTHINRFRGNLAYAGSTGELPGMYGPAPGAGAGEVEEGRGALVPRPGGPAVGPGPGSSSGPAVGPGPGSSSGPAVGPGPGSASPPMPGRPGGLGGPGGFPGFGGPGGYFGSGAPRSSNEDQISGQLVEVGVYGILSLYEKFSKEEPKAEEAGGIPPVGAPPATGTPPTGTPPAGTPPATGTPPMTPAGTPPAGTPPMMPPATGVPPAPGKDGPPAGAPPKADTPAAPGKEAPPGKDAPPTGTPPKS
ncbi:MAG TPA: hypothetical protein VM597_19860 [Gemmataceae bacterium]|nr:hypothetical protein [Gemmataceae bacterium]